MKMLGKRKSFVPGLGILAFLIALLCLLPIAKSGQMLNLSKKENYMPFTTFHNITLDANLSDWAEDENLSGRDNANWYFTWNSTSLFVGLARGETFHGGESDYDVLWIYIDCEPGGTQNSVDWNGVHTLPFYADWCFLFKPRPFGDPNPYWNLRHWNGSSWQIDMPYTGNFGYPAWHWDNGIAEIEIPLQDIGNPTSVKVLFFLTNGADNWLFGASPTQNPTGQSPQNLTAYWEYPSLASGIAPNAPSNIVPELTLPAILSLLPLIFVRKRAKYGGN